MSMGTTQRKFRHFKVNPVELAIFAAVTLIFCNSVYNLFYDRPAGSLVPMLTKAKAPGSTGLSGRFPASIERRKTEVAPVAIFARKELGCEAQQSYGTTAKEIQLSGLLCGSKSFEDAQNLVKTEIVNLNHKGYSVTVFPDTKNLKFTTDYIPLVEGQNSIRVDFVYKNGKTISNHLNVARAPASKN